MPDGVTMDELLARVRRIEDRTSIDELVTRYAIACDDRDFQALGECFAEDGVFLSVGGHVEGREALVEYFRTRFRASGPTHHIPHRLVLEETAEDHARGVVLAHSEMMFADGLFLAAHRYQDRYVRSGGRWRLGERRVEFLYGMPLRELVDLDPETPRKRWPGTVPSPAELPESLDSWKTWSSAEPS